MRQTKMTTFHLGDHRSLSFQSGLIRASDETQDSVTVWVGIDTLNDAIADYLPRCDRSTQERLMQTLTDHIRKTDNAGAAQ